MWIGLFEWVKNVKIFIFCVTAHKTVTLAEEDFNDEGDRMTHFMDSI